MHKDPAFSVMWYHVVLLCQWGIFSSENHIGNFEDDTASRSHILRSSDGSNDVPPLFEEKLDT